MPENLPPHPLVAGLAAKLAGGTLHDAIAAANKASETSYGQAPERASTEVTEFGRSRTRPELSVFAGYLADCVEQDGTTWQLLFIDDTADRYLLVPHDRIHLYARVKDETAAFGSRDVIWVDGDAPIGEGERTQSVAGRFLAGGFTRAGDFRGSVSVAPSAGASGLLCQAATPGCCGRRSY